MTEPVPAPSSAAREALLADLAERALGAVQPEIDRLRANLTTVFHQLKAAERDNERLRTDAEQARAEGRAQVIAELRTRATGPMLLRVLDEVAEMFASHPEPMHQPYCVAATQGCCSCEEPPPPPAPAAPRPSTTQPAIHEITIDTWSIELDNGENLRDLAIGDAIRLTDISPKLDGLWIAAAFHGEFQSTITLQAGREITDCGGAIACLYSGTPHTHPVDAAGTLHPLPAWGQA